MKYFLIRREKIKIKRWKQNSLQYLFELEKFLDRVSNIKDKELREDIIVQVLRCDRELTKLAEEMFKKYYLKGYQKAQISIKK